MVNQDLRVTYTIRQTPAWENPDTPAAELDPVTIDVTDDLLEDTLDKIDMKIESEEGMHTFEADAISLRLMNHDENKYMIVDEHALQRGEAGAARYPIRGSYIDSYGGRSQHGWRAEIFNIFLRNELIFTGFCFSDQTPITYDDENLVVSFTIYSPTYLFKLFKVGRPSYSGIIGMPDQVAKRHRYFIEENRKLTEAELEDFLDKGSEQAPSMRVMYFIDQDTYDQLEDEYQIMWDKMYPFSSYGDPASPFASEESNPRYEEMTIPDPYQQDGLNENCYRRMSISGAPEPAPVLGNPDEELTDKYEDYNGNFDDWSGLDPATPDCWNVGLSGYDAINNPIIQEVGSGETWGGTGNGSVCFRLNAGDSTFLKNTDAPGLLQKTNWARRHRLVLHISDHSGNDDLFVKISQYDGSDPFPMSSTYRVSDIVGSDYVIEFLPTTSWAYICFENQGATTAYATIDYMELYQLQTEQGILAYAMAQFNIWCPFYTASLATIDDDLTPPSGEVFGKLDIADRVFDRIHIFSVQADPGVDRQRYFIAVFYHDIPEVDSETGERDYEELTENLDAWYKKVMLYEITNLVDVVEVLDSPVPFAAFPPMVWQHYSVNLGIWVDPDIEDYPPVVRIYYRDPQESPEGSDLAWLSENASAGVAVRDGKISIWRMYREQYARKEIHAIVDLDTGLELKEWEIGDGGYHRVGWEYKGVMRGWPYQLPGAVFVLARHVIQFVYLDLSAPSLIPIARQREIDTVYEDIPGEISYVTEGGEGINIESSNPSPGWRFGMSYDADPNMIEDKDMFEQRIDEDDFNPGLILDYYNRAIFATALTNEEDEINRNMVLDTEPPDDPISDTDNYDSSQWYHPFRIYTPELPIDSIYFHGDLSFLDLSLNYRDVNLDKVIVDLAKITNSIFYVRAAGEGLGNLHFAKRRYGAQQITLTDDQLLSMKRKVVTRTSEEVPSVSTGIISNSFYNDALAAFYGEMFYTNRYDEYELEIDIRKLNTIRPLDRVILSNELDVGIVVSAEIMGDVVVVKTMYFPDTDEEEQLGISTDPDKRVLAARVKGMSA